MTLDIAAIKARADTATAGPWKPVAQGGSSTIVAPVLPARNDRRSAVSYGYRDDAGYCIGYPFLYQPEPFKSEEQTRMDFVCFSHADAAFIAHARTDIPALIAALEAAERERDEYRAKLMNLADAPSVKGMSWNGFNVIGDDKSIAAVQSAVHYGGQIDEYRAAFLQRKAALEAERDALKKALKPFADAKIPETVMGQYIKISTMTVAFNGEHDITPSAFKIARRALEGKP